MSSRETTDARRQQIVEACLELLAEGSLEALSTRRIAQRLGLSQPALFRHFQSMEAVLVAAVEHAKGQIEGEVQGVLEAGGPALDQLRALATAIGRQAERMPGLPRLILADSVELPSGVRDALRRVIAMLTALAGELFRQAGREGALGEAPVEPRRAGRAFVALIQGTVLQWQLGGRRPGLAEEVGSAVRLLLDGAAGSAAATAGAGAETATPKVRGALERLDVKPILARGEEPLPAILAALERVGPSGVLFLSAPFRPAPLIALLRGRGHAVEERSGAQKGSTALTIVHGGHPAIVDLTDLPPPEPLEAVLEASASLEAGAVYLARVPRHPRWLLPELERRGLVFEVLEEPDGAALLRVQRPERRR
jgi:AcrR family transcriptional regulator